MVSRYSFPVAALVGAALFISACGRTEPVASEATTTTSATTVPVSVAVTEPPTTAAEAPTGYVVQPGDSLGGIASAFGLRAEALAEYNSLENPDRISVGQQLLIPPGATSTSTTPTTAAAPPAETTTTAAG